MTKTLKKGFTLVELVVVIAIIAILSTVSVVGYSAFIKNANQSKVDQELAQVENILMAEAIEGIETKTTSDKTISMTLEGTTLVFKVTTVATEGETAEEKQADFKALLEAAEVDQSMIDNMTLVHVPEQGGEPEASYIRYQIDAEYSDIIVIVKLVE